MRTLFIAAAGIFFFAAILGASFYGMRQGDIATCQELEEQAEARPPLTERNPGGFYITPADAAMCEALKVPVAAVVFGDSEDLQANSN